MTDADNARRDAGGAHTGDGPQGTGTGHDGQGQGQGSWETPTPDGTDTPEGPEGPDGLDDRGGRGGPGGSGARRGPAGPGGAGAYAGSEGPGGSVGPRGPRAPDGIAGRGHPAGSDGPDVRRGPADAAGPGGPGEAVGWGRLGRLDQVRGRGGSRWPGIRGTVGQEQSTYTHAGNGTVNHGPADQGPDTRGPDGLDPDELALRAMLQHAVQDVRPSDGTLEHLRRAVPARRARKRQAVVGMAAAALFIGTAVPALVHVSHSTGPGADPSVAGNASQAHGGVSQGKDPAGGQSGVAGTGGTVEDGDKADPEKTPDDKESGGASTGSTPGGAEPSASAAADVPPCTAKQLGPAVVASITGPDSTGVVYGSFRVTNVSAQGCTVTGPGSVVTGSAGAADATRVGTARHAAGDAAAGLPDPSLESPSLTLAPDAGYEVRFAWVPSETCPTDPGDGTTGGGTGGPSPDPSPTDTPTAGGTTTSGGGGGTDGGAEAGPTAQLLTADGPADGSVSVTYTPEGGSGSATATVSNACAGTVYWTGVLAGTETR